MARILVLFGTTDRHTLTALMGAMWLWLGVSLASAQPTPVAPEAAFLASTNHYAQMHRRLEQPIGNIAINTPIESINRMIEELAAAIRVQRADARQGDLFTPAVARELRLRINDALLAHDFTAFEVAAAGQVDGVDYGRVNLRVNGTFPWVLGVAMLPCLIEALPPLPPELQYRIVGYDLVLIDVHASLIVDILPAALADMMQLVVPKGVPQ